MSKNAVMPLTDYVAACDAIREKTGSADLIKSGDMPDKINTVYEAGKQAQNNDEFWNDYMEGVKANPYSNKYVFAGPGWTDKTFNPNMSVTPKNAQGMFFQSYITDLKGILEKKGVTFDFSQNDSFTDAFYYSKITNFPVIDVTGTTRELTRTFCGLTMENVSLPLVIKDDGTTVFSSTTFNASTGLTNLTIEGGVIGQNGFDVSACINLTVESLLSIINALMDYSTLTSIVNVSLPPFTNSILDIYELVEGKTYITTFYACYTSELDGGLYEYPLFENASAVAQKIDVYGVGERVGVHYIADYWADENYTYNLVLYQEPVDQGEGWIDLYFDELRYIQHKTTGEVTLMQNDGDRIIVQTKSGDGAHTITLGAENLAKLTDAEKVQATEKGWSIL